LAKRKSNLAITAIDLFAGAGGLSLAARNLGVHVLAAVEKFNHACDTYERNFIKWQRTANLPRLYREDITTEDLPSRMMSDLGLKPGDLDILMGGPPCQGFSTHRIKDSGIDDPRNDLLLRYFDFVKALKPKAFVVENVPGLLWPRHAEYLTRFRKFVRASEYTLIGPHALNARDFGVPQNRKRIFMVGIQNDLEVDFHWPAATHGDPDKATLPGLALIPWMPASKVFNKRFRPNDPNNHFMNHSEDMIARFMNTPHNGGSRKDSGFLLPCHEEHNGHKDVYGRIAPTKPGPTMTTACINPSKGRFVHPTENHGITVRHAARFQCFPDKFVFLGGLIAEGIQVGNAVPILLGEAILTAVSKLQKKWGNDE
jgi:DNA (cytosine-5)-methyltransferase 1